MVSEQFRDAVRQRLKLVPLESRRNWNQAELFRWWLVARNEDPQCTSGDVDVAWYRVKRICADLLGPQASE